jgi:hypothetical protein
VSRCAAGESIFPTAANVRLLEHRRSLLCEKRSIALEIARLHDKKLM